MVNSIKLEKEAQQKLISQIKTSFKQNVMKLYGELASGKVLKFIVEKCDCDLL